MASKKPRTAASKAKKNIDSAPKGTISTPEIVDAAEFSALVGLSIRNVRQLAQINVLVRAPERGKFYAKASLHAYFDHLRNQAAGRSGNGKLILADERARLAKEQADKHEIENKKLRGELYSEKEIAAGWSAIARVLKSGVLTLASKSRAALPHLTAEDALAIDKLCRELLEDMAKEVEQITIAVDENDGPGEADGGDE